MPRLHEQFSRIIKEDGRHVLNLGVLSLLCTAYAYGSSTRGTENTLSTIAFLLGIILGMVALYHGRISPTKYQTSYTAGYIVSIFTVFCSLLGIVLNIVVLGSVFG